MKIQVRTCTGCYKSGGHCFHGWVYSSGLVEICEKKLAAKLFITLKINVNFVSINYIIIISTYSGRWKQEKFKRNHMPQAHRSLKKNWWNFGIKKFTLISNVINNFAASIFHKCLPSQRCGFAPEGGDHHFFNTLYTQLGIGHPSCCNEYKKSSCTFRHCLIFSCPSFYVGSFTVWSVNILYELRILP